MAEPSTIARPYAEAAFQQAKQASDLAGWSRMIARLAAGLQDPATSRILANPAFASEKLVQVLAEVCGAYSAEQKNFLQLLVSNERLAVAAPLADAFEALRNAHEQVVDAHIVSAFPLDALQQQSLMDVLRAKYGKQVKLSVEVDESLIGGVVIQIGDEVMDASIRGKVSQLADALR
ncbi:MAG: F0F1 ATP synthase subunit delta [Betaproteobacteria bacterium]|nr:F0F1 ATP synthase subunit delta [Pseudomonadota bacterium]NBO11317.1 F0F1 ATP synthase subunit delta [Betaproteobacteria bacterium]NBO44716.1 F0F1 ATP synthase subunit delta [Betaproteobacteria bacterium]NBP09566.1 F0F1 ATP synthase subunit delta [Betaproteobacteria bacterium]NBP60893.1 F0F1 ATP synthase subunit delta [Betaproteobacteria bacterium]